MSPDKPTQMRHRIVAVTTLTAVLLYLDRVCIAEIAKLDEFKKTLGLTEQQTGYVISAFFFAYALGQVPAGWLSDKFGARGMMTFYIALWSLCTALTGFAGGFVSLVIARMGFGLAQAGAYPASNGLVRLWTPLAARGKASSIVSLGGRLGGAIAPALTAWLLSDLLGWRAVLMLYGVSGLLVAGVFWWLFRNSPVEHPMCNEAERRLILEGSPAPAAAGAAAPPFPWRELLCSWSMWLMCVLQWGVNIGWVFLVSWLPTYLKDVKGVDPRTAGLMSTIVLLSGMVGMLVGGWLTDWLVQRVGLRWGRAIPLIGTKFAAVLAYLACLWLESPWAIVAALSLVAFTTDLGVPAVWAFIQDVGGRFSSTIFGWANMWGNFGAALTPALIPWVLKTYDTDKNWHEAFLLCAAGFLVAAVAAFGINADKTIGTKG